VQLHRNGLHGTYGFTESAVDARLRHEHDLAILNDRQALGRTDIDAVAAYGADSRIDLRQ
jgi:hypothetical protein